MKLAPLILLSLFLMGCSSTVAKDKVVGKYVLSVDSGADVVELKADGTYIHSFQNKEATKATQSGKWTLENLDAGPTVTLESFQPLLGEHGLGEGFYLLEVRSVLGKIRLITDQDLNEGYERQP